MERTRDAKYDSHLRVEAHHLRHDIVGSREIYGFIAFDDSDHVALLETVPATSRPDAEKRFALRLFERQMAGQVGSVLGRIDYDLAWKDLSDLDE